MSEMMIDLRNLIEAVEAGTVKNPSHANEFAAVGRAGGYARDAYQGSLDGASNLHGSLLPGWDFSVSTSWVTISEAEVSAPRKGSFKGRMDPFGKTLPDMTPARAWLLAILKAYEATHA